MKGVEPSTHDGFPYLQAMVESSGLVDDILRSESDQVQQDIVCLLEEWMAGWSEYIMIDCHSKQLLDEVCQKVVDGRRRAYNKINKNLMELGREKCNGQD